jgi:hypothetical protein
LLLLGPCQIVYLLKHHIGVSRKHRANITLVRKHWFSTFVKRILFIISGPTCLFYLPYLIQLAHIDYREVFFFPSFSLLAHLHSLSFFRVRYLFQRVKAYTCLLQQRLMTLLKTLLTAASAVRVATALTVPTNQWFAVAEGYDRAAPPIWNFANETTPDAKADGSAGVIIEPDLASSGTGKDGATVKRVKLGPYTLQPGQKREYPISYLGLSPSDPGLPLPCTSCYITAMQLSLEYPDGSVANVDTGAWLHHVDISVTGVDYTCPSNPISFILAGGDPAMGGSRIYAGGNERTPIRLNSKSKFGIDPGWGTMGGAVELMSENTKPITVYTILTIEYVPKSTPGYREARLVWVDVVNCAKTSDFVPSTGVYQKQSREFSMKHDGELVFANGHMHDGGVTVELYVNNKLSCTSKQLYANRRGHYTEPKDGTVISHMVMPAGSHISDVGVCKDWGKVKKGDTLTVKGYFDATTHKQMMNGKGVLEEQMGIMWLYGEYFLFLPVSELMQRSWSYIVMSGLQWGAEGVEESGYSRITCCNIMYINGINFTNLQ